MTDASPPPMPVTAASTTRQVAETVDESKPRVFPCEACGADLAFNIGVQQLKCPYCGFVKHIEVDPDAEVAEQDFAAMLERVATLRKDKTGAETDLKELRCDGCGGTVQFTGTLTSTECAYCGSPLQLNNVHDSPTRVPVDGILAFTISREQARTNLGQWVRSRWFAPDEFKKRGVQGRFNGIYLPFWTYDSLTTNHYVGQRGVHYYVVSAE